MKRVEKKITIPEIAAALRHVFDPEIGFNIVDMGLIYGLEIEKESVKIILTFSSPACPLGEVIDQDIRAAMKDVFGDIPVQLQLTFDPQWNYGMMSELARNSM